MLVSHAWRKRPARLLRRLLGTPLIDEVCRCETSEAPDLASEVGLVGISGISCRRSQGCASVSGTDETLEAKHLLEHLGGNPDVLQQDAAEMPGADSQGRGHILDWVLVK